MTKKFYCFFITTLIFSLCMFLPYVSATSETDGDYTYSIENGEATITAVNTKISGEVSIPSTLGEYPVIKIGDNAFKNCQEITRITIPEGVVSIGYQAFYGCTGLTDVVISDSVTSIDGRAFMGCVELKKVIIPDNVTSIGTLAFADCIGLVNVTIGKNVTTIGKRAFYDCDGLKNITIPDSVTKIEDGAFYGCSYLTSATIGSGIETIPEYMFFYCSNLTSVSLNNNIKNIERYAFWGCSLNSIELNDNIQTIGAYAFGDEFGNVVSIEFNGSRNDYDAIEIDSTALIGQVNCFYYVTFVYDDHTIYNETKTVVKKVADGRTLKNYLNTKYGYTPYLVIEGNSHYGINRTVEENRTFFVRYSPNWYTVTLLNHDGTLHGSFDAEYGTQIILADADIEPTAQYTYTFIGWSGYTEGMTLTGNVTFKAMYSLTVNQYTYTFTDTDGTILKSETADYGTVIIAPEVSCEEYYDVSWGESYTKGKKLVENVSFKAVYTYKEYKITGYQSNFITTVKYNSHYKLKTNEKIDYNFIGYFTEANGSGTRITDENGNSLKPYDKTGDMTVYPHYISSYMNKAELQGSSVVNLGDVITQNLIFATDKNARNMSVTIRYPKFLNFKDVKGIDFIEATKNSELISGDFKYLTINCIYDYNGGTISTNQKLVPFKVTFDVPTNAPLGTIDIILDKVTLIGSSNYEINNITKTSVEILPKLAESIEIIGEERIDKSTQFVAVFLPDYTTNKSVVWSLDKEDVATISADGILSPIVNGKVTITATAKDGSNVFATKTVEIVAYAKIDDLDFGEGVAASAFDPDTREYTVYLREDAQTITLTPNYSIQGVVRPNGSGLWYSGVPMSFNLNGDETTITLHRENVTDMTNSIYTIKVIRADDEKTIVSDDGKEFVIKSYDLTIGNKVFLALYDNAKLVDMQTALYTGELIVFSTEKKYTNAQVMVWESMANLKPVCSAETFQ